MPTMTPTPPHVPVLRDRVVALVADAPAGAVVDVTLGAGGHAEAVLDARLDRHGAATLVGLDRDPHALQLAGDRLARFRDDPRVRLELVRTRFDAFDAVLDELAIERVAAVVLDLGLSSMHVDDPERGFSYRHAGPLDMRMDPDQPRSADDLVNTAAPGELVRILRTYGEERFATRIVRAIVDARPVTTTTQLAEVVRDAIPQAGRRHGGHPATRTFQALRIAVNDELEALDALLPTVVDRLLPGGVVVALSYHSLEDRLVKRAFAAATASCTCPPELPVCVCGGRAKAEHLIRRPERPDELEVASNPRASSALLRAVRRLPEVPS